MGKLERGTNPDMPSRASRWFKDQGFLARGSHARGNDKRAGAESP
ncbi:MAG: hypothetical protein ACLQDV_05515 [Candidatus Binataceae bacterium]